MSFACIARPELIATTTTAAVEAVEVPTKAASEAARLELANVIYQQLGGRRIGAMIKLQRVYAIEGGLQIRFSNNAAGLPNLVEIKLDPSDTYNVTFSRIRGLNITTTSEHSGIYNDMLVSLFERKTGLLLSF